MYWKTVDLTVFKTWNIFLNTSFIPSEYKPAMRMFLTGCSWPPWRGPRRGPDPPTLKSLRFFARTRVFQQPCRNSESLYSGRSADPKQDPPGARQNPPVLIYLFAFLLKREFFKTHAQIKEAHNPVDPRCQNKTFPERRKIHLSLYLFAFL